jgi:hypothetical protein
LSSAVDAKSAAISRRANVADLACGWRVGIKLLPNWRKMDVACHGHGATGVINATGEELLWRGVFLEPFRMTWCAVCSGRLPGFRFLAFRTADDLVTPSH